MAEAFSLDSIELLDGPFKQAGNLTQAYLLSLEPERLLAGFRINSGLEAKAEIYGGWESLGLAGHSVGHYLTAASQAYSRTRDSRFHQKVELIVKGLLECQESRGDGFLSAFRFSEGFDRQRLEGIWKDISEGKLKSAGFDLNGMWAPWYVHHKILVGLMDAWRLCGISSGLKAAVYFAEWACEITKNLDDVQWQTMLNCEYGGMNEALADLYSLTYDERFLNLARKFYDSKVLDPIKQGRDELGAKHANTQIPKVLGLARLYEIEKKAEDEDSALFFWDRVVNHHTYVIGGHSNGEYFGPAGQLADRLSSNTCETCNTYNMLRLTKQLFCWNPSAHLADFYERAYLNHILASQHPQKGGYTYFVPLSSGSSRSFSDPTDDFTCCHGTGMETHSKHGEFIFMRQGSSKLFVNLFLPSRLTWKEAGITLSMTSSQPFGGEMLITIEDGSAEFDMLVRHPVWLKKAIEFIVNGESVGSSEVSSSYFSLRRIWSAGDTLKFNLPFDLYQEPTPDNHDKIALLYGPLVLAADIGSAEEPAPWNPVLIKSQEAISEWLTETGGGFGHFSVTKAARPYELTLRPFFDHPDNRTAIYFDQFSLDDWQMKEAEFRAKEEEERRLAAKTVDHCTLGEMQPERDHDLTCERNDVREVNSRGIRTPLTNGWLELNLKTAPEAQNTLVLNLWGNDRIHSVFRILMNGVVISEHDLAERPLNQFFNLMVDVPMEISEEKSEIRLRIEAVDDKPGPTLAAASIIKS